MHQRQRASGAAARAHRLLQRFFPPAFRQVYGEDLEAAFLDLWRRERGRSVGARIRFWLATLRDMIGQGLTERWQEGVGRGLRPGPRRPLREPPVRGVAHAVEQAAVELRRGLRSLSRRPGLVLATVVPLAVGLAGATAIWGTVHDVLVAPLGYRQEDRLVGVWMKTRWGEQVRDRFGVSDAQIVALREGVPALEDLAYVFIADLFGGVLEPPGEAPRRVEWTGASWNFFTVLGVEARLGRTFAPPDADAGRDLVVLSHAAWQRYFGGDEGIVGRAIRLGGRPRVVVGVLPPDFRWLDFERRVDFWIPYALDPERVEPFFFWSVGRLAPGATPQRAEEQASPILEAVMETGSGAPDVDGPLATVVPLRAAQLGDPGPWIRTLAGAGALLLALAVANVAILMLVRLAGLGRECVVRSALGGGPGRAVAPLVAEAAWIVTGAAGLALPAAAGALYALRATAPSGIPRVETISVSGPILAGGLLAAALALAVVSLAPAWLLKRLDLAPALQGTAAQVAGGRLPRRVRGTLVTTQVALAVVLLVGAGLLTRSFVSLLDVDPGFTTEDVLQGRLVLPTQPFWEPVDFDLEPGGVRLLRVSQEHATFREALERRLEADPSVAEAVLASHTPLSGRYGGFTPFVTEGREGEAMPGGDHGVSANAVDPDFLPFLGVELVAGRWLSEEDDAAAPPVALVSERLARRFWPEGGAVGGRFRSAQLVPDGSGGATWEEGWTEVVGVVRSLREWAYEQADETVYTPLAQRYETGSLTMAASRGARLSILVRHAGDPEAAAAHVRTVVAELLPAVPVEDLRALDRVVADWLRDPRFYTGVFGAFGLVALILAASGIAAVVGFGVASRTREIGVRLALGAAPTHIADAVAREVALFTLCGLLLGGVVAFMGSGVAEAVLYGIGPRDPVAFTSSIALLVLSVVVGGWLAGRRAFLVDPAEALRHE